MTFAEFLGGNNPIVGGGTVLYLGASVVVWRKAADIGNLAKARASALNAISSDAAGRDFVDVIDLIVKQDPKLLMPPGPNKLFLLTSALALFLGTLATFFAPFIKMLPWAEKVIYGEVALFVVVAAFGFYVMAAEYRYLGAVIAWVDQYKTKGGTKTQVVLSPTAVPAATTKTP